MRLDHLLSMETRIVFHETVVSEVVKREESTRFEESFVVQFSVTVKKVNPMGV